MFSLEIALLGLTYTFLKGRITPKGFKKFTNLMSFLRSLGSKAKKENLSND